MNSASFDLESADVVRKIVGLLVRSSFPGPYYALSGLNGVPGGSQQSRNDNKIKAMAVWII